MKILIIAESIRAKARDSNRQVTGVKKILGDIYYSEKLNGKKYFWPSSITNEQFQGGKALEFLPNNKISLLLSNDISIILECMKLILVSFRNIKAARTKVIKRLQYGYIARKIREIKPDIVHLHDLAEIHSEIVENLICGQISYIITLHIYIGKASKMHGYGELQEREKNTFTLPNINDLHITCVSSNLRNRLLTDYSNINAKNVSTILNGTDFSFEESRLNIRLLNKIDKKKKIILCIGGLSERKNQVQILKAIKQMKVKDKEGFIVLFIGEADIKIKNEFDEYCLMNDIQYSAQFIGPVSISEIHRYYAQSDFVISASINEAFGLTFIEGFVYGLPAITFSDLDAIDDLYDEKVMVLAKDRTDDSLKNAILSALNKQWDKEYIKKYARKFSVENMVNGYNNLYFKVLKGKY